MTCSIRMDARPRRLAARRKIGWPARRLLAVQMVRQDHNAVDPQWMFRHGAAEAPSRRHTMFQRCANRRWRGW
ncbi:hypothetical protein CKO40_03390 [Halochromatium glycolicum]|uniref:Uncharacterized protein n=1 Tax=Halochromatium glycolicum TaxID=85075 RepID=A0AAJ0U1M8_9GAMM|nr:hypothetical protein [Halochromatium glycolicum]